MMPDPNTRIALYWLVSSCSFGWLGVLAAQRYLHGMTRPRMAVLFFALSWAILCGQNAYLRFIHGTFISSSHPTELLRAACCVSLLAIIWEFRARRITTTTPATNPDVWVGKERRVIFGGRRRGDPKKGS